MSGTDSKFRRQFFHGTREDLQHGDLIVSGYKLNYIDDRVLSSVYCTGTLDAAIWRAARPRCEGKIAQPAALESSRAA